MQKRESNIRVFRLFTRHFCFSNLEVKTTSDHLYCHSELYAPSCGSLARVTERLTITLKQQQSSIAEHEVNHIKGSAPHRLVKEGKKKPLCKKN